MKQETLKTGLYLRGGVWWITYSGPRPDGSWGRIRESSELADFGAAAKLRDDRVREARNDRDGIRKFVGPAQRQTTVGLLLDKLVSHYETRRLKSLRQMKVHLEHVRTCFGFMSATGVSRKVIDGYIAARREEEAADATIDRELEILRRAYSLEKEDERPLVAWTPKVPRLVKGQANARQGFVQRAEFQKLVEELPSEVLRDVAIWGYGTGMRRGEILSLAWDGYDKETKTVRLAAKDAKTGRARMIPLEGLPELAAVIARRLADRRPGCSLIFQRDGRKVGDFYTSWMRAVDRAEVPRFTFHDLRRTAVRNMVRAGIPERIAMEISGHRTRAIFDRYNIVCEKDLSEALAKRAIYEETLPKAMVSGVVRPLRPRAK